MTRKLRRDEVLRRIKDAGHDGVTADPAKLLRTWRVDGDPRQLAALLRELTSTKEAREFTKKDGAGKFHTFIVA